jgi:hypothetical protein
MKRTMHEYLRVAGRALGQVYGKPVASGAQAFTSTDASITTMPAGRAGKLVMLTATQDCFIAWNTAATSTAGVFIKASLPYFFAIDASPESGGSDAVFHVIQSSTAGTLYWTVLDDVM